jgi:general secretion pathway protein D
MVIGWGIGSELSLRAGSGATSGGTTSLAEREVAKRQGQMKEAQALMVEAGLMLDQQNLEEAMRLYHEAYDLLPDSPMAAEAKLAARDGYSRAANAQAAKLAREARYPEARKLLAGILDESFNPENVEAKRQLREMEDPDRFEPADSPEHKANAAKVNELLRDASSFVNLGEFDSATKKYQEVLLVDKYNTTARRGMEHVEQLRSQYFESARDHTRSKALSAVSALWEDAIPPLDLSSQFGAGSSLVSVESTKDTLLGKLKSWIIPTVDLQGATLDEVVEFLRIRSRELDPKGKGISFVVRVPADLAAKPVTLNLAQVPLIEVLRYVTESTGTAYRMDGYAVTISSLSEKNETLISQTYRVPPGFLQNAPVGAAAAPAGAAPANPFGPAAGAAPEGGAFHRIGAKEFLEAQGVTFPEGAAANYNPTTGLLLVRNTPQNIALVDTLVDQALSTSPRQVEISVKMIDVSQTRLTELGFDWLLGQFNVPGSSGVFGSGGTSGNQASADDLIANMPGGLGSNASPVTTGLRGVGTILNAPSIDSLIKNGIGKTASSAKAPGIFSVSGFFTDPQFQTVLHGLENNKGLDLMASPSVVTKSGQRATIVVARELRYPTEFSPPQIPQSVGSSRTSLISGGTIVKSVSQQGNAPITPTTPTAFEKRDVGITLEVEPVISPDGRTVDLNIAPSSVEFEGFIDYGTPIRNSITSFNLTEFLFGTGSGLSSINFLQENKILQPIFRTNKVSTSVSVWDGNTIVLGGVVTESSQNIKDKVPVLGNLPLVGRAFQSSVTSSEKKAVIFFVSVKVIDPGGVRMSESGSTAAR